MASLEIPLTGCVSPSTAFQGVSGSTAFLQPHIWGRPLTARHADLGAARGESWPTGLGAYTAVGVVTLVLSAIRCRRHRQAGLRHALAPNSAAKRCASTTRQASREGEFNIPGVMHTENNMQGRQIKRAKGIFGLEEVPDDESWDLGEESKKRMAADDDDNMPRSANKIGYVSFVMPKKKLPELLMAWAASDKATEEQREALEELAATELPKGWAVWGLAESRDTPGGPGFYLKAPCEPQAICVMEAVDAGQNDLKHVAADPAAMSDGMRDAFEDWMESLRPKKVILQRPDELILHGLEVEVERKGSKANKPGGVKVSKGL
ncbi:unnamed protein product [Polarella glacialis]|uniref:Uncharacterized protein n=1 Tax=Polarella glacialis TaxID=89957 RepID=A0A813H3Y1_POLGL|nr:unnamed protein product [Polarella glacialis]|mmetsp:Transcript_132/g.242  ORF Transcript_132/g.242 Transcript_132/m.242 type:complete len:321 (-) Transcript_132:209-1171(-)